MCARGGIFSAWRNFSSSIFPLSILKYLSLWRNYFWWNILNIQFFVLVVMFEGLDFDLPESIGSFRNVDDLLLTLNSLVHVSEQVWSGISNEAPFQSLVNKIREMQEFASEQKLKRPRNDIFDVVTSTVEEHTKEPTHKRILSAHKKRTDKIFITLLKIRKYQFVFQMPREPEGKILNFLEAISIDFTIARDPSKLQF